MDAKIEELIASRCNLFITGAAGTGKSYLTREIISRLCTYTYVTAPTGIAAI
jgi:tRNA A37 threonylcarbamoyladenosine biosynthesis protein TsaE